MDISWLMYLIPALTFGAGSFVGAYLKKKGENLATREDIENVLAQVRAVTQTTKEIESKISGDLWDRQKRWELKRDAIFETLKQMAVVENELTEMHVAYRDAKERTDGKTQAFSKLNNALNDLDRVALILGMACNEELHKKMLEFIVLLRSIAKDIIEGCVDEKWTAEYLKKKRSATDLMRAELYNAGPSQTRH